MHRRNFLAAAAGVGAALALPAFAVSPPPAPLPMDLAVLEARHGGRIGVCAIGPGRAVWRAEERFAYASTFKLFLAACVLGRVQQGLERLAHLERWLVETPTGAGRIKAAVPAGWRVAHKTGTGARNSYNNIGVAYPPSGAPVAVAVYYTGAEGTPEQLDAVVAEATRAALVALGRV